MWAAASGAYLVGLLEDGGDVANGENEVGLQGRQRCQNQKYQCIAFTDLDSKLGRHTSQNIPIPGSAHDFTQKKKDVTAFREWNLRAAKAAEESRQAADAV